MYFNSLSSSGYINELVQVNFNEVDPPLANARIGTRFYHFYYDTWNEKINFSNTTIDTLTGDDDWNRLIGSGYPRDYVLTGLEIDEEVIPDNFSYAISPSIFGNPNDYQKLLWQVNGNREFLYFNYLAGTGAGSIYPSHVYPKITKINNNTLLVSACMMPATGFDGLVTYTDFKQRVAAQPSVLIGLPNLLSATNFGTRVHTPYVSKTTINKVLGSNKNFIRNYYVKSVGKNIIANSFKIEVPVLTSKVDPEVDEVNGYILTFTTGDVRQQDKRIYTTGINLSCLESEDLSGLGITYPYTPVYSKLIPSTGQLWLYFRAPLWIEKNSPITITYQTSSFQPNISITNNTIGNNPNYWQISANNVEPVKSGVFYYNYKFARGTFYDNSAEDAFTISFLPSSFITNVSYSSVTVDTAMVDNYYQTSFEITDSTETKLVKRFVEQTDDDSLSAVHIASNRKFKNKEWFRADGPIRFYNNGVGNRHYVKIQLSSYTGAIYEEEQDIEFLINKNNIIFSPTITETDSNSATITTIIYPTQSDSSRFKWAAFPPENVVFSDLDGEPLSANVFYDQLIDVQVQYLGVDKTEIVIYSEEFATSASTFWFPPSTVVNDMYLEIKGQIDDNNKTGTGTISAFCNRNGRSYRVPVDANIIWDEVADDGRGIINFNTRDRSRNVDKGTIYSSSNEYSLINATISSIPVTENPKFILFNVTCNASRNDFALNASKIFLYREYPAGNLLSINATSGSNSLFSSVDSQNIIFTTSTNLTLSAIYPNLDTSSIRWQAFYNKTKVLNGTGDTFNFSLSTLSSICIQVSATSAKPFQGDFKRYNFEDSMCFYYLSSLTNLNYIGFPENQYNPTRKAANSVVDYGKCGSGYENTVFNMFTSSHGMTSYKPCHTENFYFSASPGFTKYVWNVGDIVAESSSNKIIIPVSYQNVSANNNITVSAFNDIFLETDLITNFNFASSNNSNVYRQRISFLDFPNPSVSIELTNDVVNTNLYSTLPRLIATINSGNFDINDYTFNIVLSSADFVQTKLVQNNRPVFNALIDIGIEDSDFIIDENSFNKCVIYLSGNASVTIDGFDFCPTSNPVSSNILSLSAYNGPNLELYCEKNIVSAGETVTFYNGSNKNFINVPFINFQSFTFDNGEGTISNPASGSLYFTTTYSTEGSKTPSLTGVLNTGETVVASWKDFVSVKDSFENYDSNISRAFYEKLELPYNLDSVRVKPNDWQYASTLNSSFDKLKTNIFYLSASCAINNINFPKAYGGYLGTRFGNFKWHTQYVAENLQDNLFYRLRSAQIVDEKAIVLNGKNIEIFDISENPSKLFSTDRISDAEVLLNPVKLSYLSVEKRLYILDNTKKIIYVCNFDINNPSNIELTHYWGGVGSKEDRTKFNNPVDFCLDSKKNLYVVDSDSAVIKVYNKNLNWIRNISISNFDNNKPLSISERNGLFCVSTQNGINILMDEFGNVSESITHSGSTKSVLNTLHEGIVYIISGKNIAKYTINNTFVNENTFNDNVVDVVFDEFHCYAVFSDYILKFVDFIEINKVINNNETLSGFNWNSIFINESEFVTDYIFNDSFKKIHDNISLLNGRIEERLMVDLDKYYRVINQTTTAYTPSAVTDRDLFVATNEPVLYDTINRGIENLYSNVEELRDNISATFSIPNNNNDIQWRWSYHYIDGIQLPTLEKNPVSWREMTSSKIIGNSQLSAYSAWWTTREGRAGNHSEICWNYEQVQCNSLFPLSWHDTECSNVSGHIFTWEDLEKDCCALPDFVFADCVSPC